MFKEHFDRTVCEGEYIECMVNQFWCRASIIYDHTNEDEDAYEPQRSDFKSQAAYERALGREYLARQALKDGDWWYGAVEVSVRVADPEWPDDWTEATELGSHALWGVDVNYPTFDKRRRPNKHLRDTANDCLHEALAEARERWPEHVAKILGGERWAA